jgi:hypothetical protein
MTIPAQTASDGTSMFPVPRMALASAFISHTRGVPRNTMLEYMRAASSAAPLPPSPR